MTTESNVLSFTKSRNLTRDDIIDQLERCEMAAEVTLPVEHMQALLTQLLTLMDISVAQSADREMLKRLAVILSGSDAPGEIKALTVTAQSLVDRCKTLAKERDARPAPEVPRAPREVTCYTNHPREGKRFWQRGWNDCRAAMLQGGGEPASQRSELKEALAEAVAAIYFNDSTDYFSALWAVVRALSPETAELLESNEKAAFDSTRLPAAPKEAL